MKRLGLALAVLMLGGACAPKTAAPQRGPNPPPARTAPRVPRLPFIRPYIVGAGEVFVARRTFDATFASPVQPFVGGGAQFRLFERFYAEATVSAWQWEGERAYVANGQVYNLGVPFTATLLPAELTIGRRFPLSPTNAWYIAAGAGWYTYVQDRGTVDESMRQHQGFVGNLGFEHRWKPRLQLAFDGQYTYVPQILGRDGLSMLTGEKDLGGVAARVRLIFGR